MSHRLESDLSTEVLDFLNGDPDKHITGLPNCFAYKTHGGQYQRSGIPDIIGCYKGRFFGVELKIGDNYPSPLQRKTLREIREAGGMAITAWTLETVVEMIAILDEMIAKETE